MLSLVIHDDCIVPSIEIKEDITRVIIGTQHDFDDILDVASGVLSYDNIALLHKLWSDDSFPRNFNRVGNELIITARE